MAYTGSSCLRRSCSELFQPLLRLAPFLLRLLKTALRLCKLPLAFPSCRTDLAGCFPACRLCLLHRLALGIPDRLFLRPFLCLQCCRRLTLRICEHGSRPFLLCCQLPAQRIQLCLQRLTLQLGTLRLFLGGRQLLLRFPLRLLQYLLRIQLRSPALLLRLAAAAA